MDRCTHEPILNHQAVFRLKRMPYYVCKNCGEVLPASNWVGVERLRSVAWALGNLFLYFVLRFFGRMLGANTLPDFIGVCFVGIITAYFVTVLILLLFFGIHWAYVRRVYRNMGDREHERR